MARADEIGRQLQQAFPGLRVTSTVRTRAEQDALIRAGKTRATNSQHLSGNGLDVVLPRGVSPEQVNRWLAEQGVRPGEFLNETGRGSNQGTGSHLHIGLAPKAAKGGDPASGGGGSSFDRAKASRDRSQGPDMAAVYRAYQNTGKAGGMTPQEASQYENAVLDGHVMLPRGASIRRKPPVAVLPRSVVDAFNSHRMDGDPEARAEIERQVAEGNVALPRGMRLQKPEPRTAMELIGMGARGVLSGLGGLVDVVAAPANIVTNAALGTNLSRAPGRSLAESVSDSLGLAKPESSTEQLYNSINEGGAQGLATAGIGMAASPLAGATGAIGRAVAANPILDTVSGAVGGGAQESARQAGAGPVGQIAAGLAGGALPVGLAGALERVAARGVRTPKAIADVVAETPRAAVIDDAGNLTPHGQEVAARQGISPDELRAAYEAPRPVQRAVANDQQQPALAREATNDAAPMQEPAPEPVQTPQEPVAAPRPVETPVSPAPTQEPVAPAALDAADRVTAAKDLGIDLTRGQATKSFDVQDAEQRLRNSNGAEGEKMRQFVAQQTEQIKQAVEQFRAGFGDTSLSAEQRGSIVQDAIRELRDQGQKGVSELYRQARELGQPVDLDTAGIKQAYDRVMVEANVPDGAKAELTQEAARYGLIGKVEGTNEAGITTVKLDDGSRVRFYGEPEPLRLDNAEAFRKVVSDLYQSDGPRKLTQTIKRAIDDAVEEAAVGIADESGGNMSEAMARARAAHVQQRQTFHAKDVVQSIADWKKGVEDVTGALKPEQVIKSAFASTSDLKRIKAVLLSNKTPQSTAAWRGIQAHGLAEIFAKATTRNTNAAGEITEAISGAKLRSAIDRFGADKLKVLLEPESYNRLMQLRRVIEDATIPISGTVNHSNSGNLLMRLVKDADNQFTAAASAAGFALGGPAGAAISGGAARMVAPAIKQARESAQAAETLKNATEYTASKALTETGEKPPSAAAKAGEAVKNAGASTVKAFIETYGNARVLAPLLAASQGEEQ